MFSLNKETMTMVAVVVALAAVFYMYQESQKMKKDISECKNASVGLAHRLASVQAPAREVNAPEPPSEEENED
ncbi:hypothetical protein N9095_00225 [bacterium]|nr:hypothetical protein [bacterium]